MQINNQVFVLKIKKLCLKYCLPVAYRFLHYTYQILKVGISYLHQKRTYIVYYAKIYLHFAILI